jgi:two-component system NtrC family sensor kinase
MRVGQEALEELRAALERSPESLLHMAKLAEMGTLLAMVVHELSQPLLGIKAFAQILARRYGQDEFLGPKLEIIVKQAEHMDELLGNLRQFGGAHAAVDRRAAPVRAVEAALELLGARARKLRVDVDLQVEGSPPEVGLTSGHIQQLLVNLLTNALDALEPRHGGRILVRLAPVPSGVRLLFGDTGPGIPEELRVRIFEPFYTTKPPGSGTGLGLPICRSILRGAGGDIRLLPPEEACEVLGLGVGAVFEIMLPEAGRGGASG